MNRRFFYRCTDCLTVVATESKIADRVTEGGSRLPNAICDACEGPIEFMGKTDATGHIRTLVGQVSPCDSRCTSAQGPNCDCPCGGENHGSQRTVDLYTSTPVPRLMVPKDAVGKAQEFKSLCEQFKTRWQAEFGELARLRRAGHRLSRELYAKLCRGQNLWIEFARTKRMKTHAGRNKKIAQLAGFANQPGQR